MKKSILIFFAIHIWSSVFCLTTEEESAVVEKIYNQVYSTLGDNGLKPIFFYNTRQAAQVAYMKKDSNGEAIIGFESKAFTVCESFGERRDDAIAFLIGHEISHHHLHHHWGQEFRSSYSLGALESVIAKMESETSKRFETQADERGGVLAYLAGYNPGGIGEDLLRAIYKSYEIKDGPNYPTLEERVKINIAQDKAVQKFIKVFESSNYALAVGEYEMAIDGYRFVINKGFRSREIFNNIGTAIFLNAFKKEDHKYFYPVELDLSSSLNAKSAKGIGDTSKKQFEDAKSFFVKAIRFDKKYATGYVNLASTFCVLEEYEDADYMLTKAKKYSVDGSNTKSNAALVEAILYELWEEGDKEISKELFAKLAKENHTLGIVNNGISNGIDASEVEVPLSNGGSKFVKKEKVNNGVTGYAMDNLYTMPSENEEEIKFNRDAVLTLGNFTASTLYVRQVSTDVGDKLLIFHSSHDNYEGETSKGIKLGSTEKEITTAYGGYTSLISTPLGHILVYQKSKIMFVLDSSNKVKQLVAFRSIIM